MERIELFRVALARCGDLRAKHPNPAVVDSIVAQLNYLIAFQTGASQDRSRIPDITLGFLAVREVADFDTELAELLSNVAAEARGM